MIPANGYVKIVHDGLVFNQSNFNKLASLPFNQIQAKVIFFLDGPS
jgi:hypothetical protein